MIERIVAEPVGGAHRQPAEVIATLGAALGEELDSLASLSSDEVRSKRRAKYLEIA